MRQSPFTNLSYLQIVCQSLSCTKFLIKGVVALCKYELLCQIIPVEDIVPILQVWQRPKLEKWSQVPYRQRNTSKPPRCSEVKRKRDNFYVQATCKDLCLILSILRSGWSGTAVRQNDPLFQDLGNSFTRDYKMYPQEPAAQKFMYDKLFW